MFPKSLLLSFIPIFVAVDAFGVLPVFLSLTERMKPHERRNVLRQSLITAFAIAVAFVFLGKVIFLLLGITAQDFMIAGGAILFILSVIDLLFPTKQRRSPSTVGVVPLGTPLIVGPAVLTTALISINSFGILVTLFSIVVNILLTGIIFASSHLLMKVLGKAGSKAISKVFSLFLAAIGVMMVRKGLMQLIR